MNSLFLISKNSLKAGLVALLLLLAAHAQAGEPVKDPLHKPDIWKQLELNPKNDALWSKYFGKDLFELTKEEGLNFKSWRSQLLSASEAGPSKKMDTSSADDIALHRLTDNISKNFFLIEDFFSAEFKKYGVEYVAYSVKNPGGTYGKVQWVEEHEKKLKELRAVSASK